MAIPPINIMIILLPHIILCIYVAHSVLDTILNTYSLKFYIIKYYKHFLYYSFRAYFMTTVVN